MERELPIKTWYYLKKKPEKNISTHRMAQWGEEARIVHKMYDLIGFQNGTTTLEESLQEIAEHISNQEGRKFSVEDAERIYKRVTSGSLASEVKFAKKVTVSEIWKMAENQRRGKELSRGYNQDEEE